ncbi:MAG: GDSL-type esterase/lipase family protein [Akkermansia sp.]
MKILLALLFALPLLASPLVAESLPTTLKPEPHQRDPYNWMNRHNAIKARHETIKPEYVFIGDSITHHWGGEPASNDFAQFGPDSWNKLFGSHTATNMGFGFDYVDNAYFRITDGELDKTSPRVIIVMIGTNNLGHRKDTPKACANNINAFVNLLTKKCPQSKILLVGILPRTEPELAPVIEKTNELIAKLNNGKTVFFINPGRELVDKDGHLAQLPLMGDTVHLNKAGYERLGSELAVALRQIDPKYQGGKVLPKPTEIQGIAPEKVKLILIGDSITDNYHKSSPPHEDFQPIWQQFYAPHNALNYGISGHKTDDIISRIDSGILDHIQPKVAVILIGTNNTGAGQSIEETVRGTKKVVSMVRERLPKTRILLLGILPNNISNTTVVGAKDPEKKWADDQEINKQIAAFYKGNPCVICLNIQKVFLKSNGKINEDLFYDPKIVHFGDKMGGPLHPDTKGQRLMAEAINPMILKMLKAPTPAPAIRTAKTAKTAKHL